MIRKLFAATVLAGVIPVCAPATTPAKVDDASRSILTNVRNAMFGDSLSSIASLHLSGKLEALGIPAHFDEWDDLKAQRFTARQTGGPLTGANGWDGTSAWNQDYAGLVTIDGGAAGRFQAIDQAYVDTFSYLRPDYGGAAIHYAGRKSDSGKSFDVLAITPPQGTELNLWIDPRTHLIAKETATIGIVSSVTRFSNYRRTSGIVYPLHSATQTSQGNTFNQDISGVRLNEDVAAEIAVPASHVQDFEIAGGSPTTVPLEIINNHLYLHLRLNGKGPYTFILDTGGDSIISPQLAQALKAQTSGKTQLSGVGATTEAAGFTHVDSIQIGDATVHNQYMLVLPIATGFGVAEGVNIDGMIGYQTVARFVMTIDYAKSALTLALPGSNPVSNADTTALQFYFDGTIPRIPITVDGVTTTGEVDTGARSGLTLSSPFLAAHPQLAARATTANGVAGFGVGGPSYAKLGRITNLQIGPYALPNTVADFTEQRQGAFADPFNPANIGGAIWRRFTVTFDYAHHQMLLAKNSEFDSPFNYDRSGLFLIASKGAYTVLDARPGTPAASVDLKKGDVILGVNGLSASTQTLAQLRSLLSAPSGTVVHLHVRGAAGERDVTLTLRDYV